MLEGIRLTWLSRPLFIGVLLLSTFPPSVAAQSSECHFQLGFKALADQIPEIVGDCLENERYNPETGNVEQHTTAHHGEGGLLVWRKSDNWTAFTDGSRTWINGPYGLQNRRNNQRYLWE